MLTIQKYFVEIFYQGEGKSNVKVWKFKIVYCVYFVEFVSKSNPNSFSIFFWLHFPSSWPFINDKQMDLRTSNYAIEPSLDYCACYEGLYTVTCTLYCACTPALSVWPPGDGWGDARPLDSPWMENLCTTHKEGSARFMRGRLANIPRSVWLYVCVWLGVCVVAGSIQITAIF